MDAQCPYCGEWVEVEVDPGGGAHQRYTEDCPVCCRPWVVTVDVSEDDEVSVDLAREDS